MCYAMALAILAAGNSNADVAQTPRRLPTM
jgi:hypothetical protein